MTAVVIRGTPYPVVLPKLRDPRLHLAATITSLQVIGQIGFHFRVSIAQILIALLTCALLEVGITMRKQHVLMWPASAMLTGNGVAFVLRVPGTQHGDWWSLRGWWIFAATAAVSLLSKHVLQVRGSHIFNPSNIGLVLCFLALSSSQAEPLDFWWGPTSWWLVLALVVIVTGGFTILSRLKLLRVALSFWVAFAAGLAVLAAAGHQITARWHLGPIGGFHFWWVLVTSPEVLVFLFFMITDPKTAPPSPRARVVYAVSIGLLAALLAAPMHTEYWTKVALLGALAIVCVVQTLLREVSRPIALPSRRVLVAAGCAIAAGYAGVLVAASPSPTAVAVPSAPKTGLPRIMIAPSPGIQSRLSLANAQAIVQALVMQTGATADSVRVWLEPGQDQSPPTAVAQLAGRTYRLQQQGFEWLLATPAKRPPVQRVVSSGTLGGVRMTDVAQSTGLRFQQGSFRFASSSDYRAMMGGGLCWLDYNGDGWQDLFVVNSYSDSALEQWGSHGGLPRSTLFENVDGTFRDVGRATHADPAVQGDGCAAADLDGDGHTDLVVTTTHGAFVLWNDGRRFKQKPLTFGFENSRWYTGAAVADVNGDGRPDVFLAGYTDLGEPLPDSTAGFPTSYAGVRDLLFLNQGRHRFREVGVAAGLEAARFGHGLGAVFLDYNRDRRPDLYVANDEDPNQLYENVPWPGGAKADPAGLGFRFEERGAAEGVADPYAGMGIAATDRNLFVTNSRREPSAAFRGNGSSSFPAFADARPAVDPALGTGFAGWGASWVDLANSGSPDLALTAGAIPVTNVAADAEPVRVLAPLPGRNGGARFGDAAGALPGRGIRVNGRGLAAADVGDDGRIDIAINALGGRLLLLRTQGAIGNWLEVETSPLTPGASVTVVLPGGHRLTREVQAGASYLSSEDPRLHFGLGPVRAVPEVIVRFPFGGTRVFRNVGANRVLVVRRPRHDFRPSRTSASYRLASCTPAQARGTSIERLWNEAAVSVLREGDASAPVAARDLFHVSAAIWDAWAAYDPTARGYFGNEKERAARPLAARQAAISYAAYRLLLWRASFGSNLARSFSLLTKRLRSLCYSPEFTRIDGPSPAALGNRIAAAAIAFGRHDGSLESQHYVDASYTPQNLPLVVARPGSALHDSTFWQPLALGQVAPRGLAPLPAKVQSFVGAQWGHVHAFALPASARGLPIDPGPPPIGDASSRTYKEAAALVIRATSGRRAPSTADASPLAWNLVADSLAPRANDADRLRQDVRLSFVLNAALNDAAVAAWGAKRTYQSPRPISMIRYMAFQGQSSDPKAPSYNDEGLPLVPGLIELVTHASSAPGQRHAALAPDVGEVAVLSHGGWVLGTRWTPSTPTPASPGWVSEDAAFAYAAGEILSAATGRSFEEQARRVSDDAVASGTAIPADVRAGRLLGTTVAKRVRLRAPRYVGG